MDRLPDEHVCSIIAHELGHAVLIAEDPGHTSDSCAHDVVDELLEQWGFDGGAMKD